MEPHFAPFFLDFGLDTGTLVHMSKSPRARFALSPEQKVDAREALRILHGSGISLTAAASRAVHGRQALHQVTLATAVDSFTLQLVRKKARPATLLWYESKLSAFVTALGPRMLDDITRPDLLAVVAAQAVGESTAASYYRAVRAVYRWAKRQEPPMVGADITEGLPTAGRNGRLDKVPGVLSLADTTAILRGAGEHRSALALMLYAGLRPQELWGQDKPALMWRHVLVAEKMIRVPADIAKTRKPRIIEGLPSAVWKWLEPRKADEPVSTVSSQWLIRTAQLAAGYSKKVAGQHTVLRPWPHDATRHSFATYALALTGDPGRVALWLGHEGNPRMLYTHYRGLATKAEAKAYFALRPD